MKRFLFGAVLVATVLLSVGISWGQSVNPAAPFWTRTWTDWSHTPIESNEKTTAYENTALLQLQPGSYFIDHCYRYTDWFVPNAQASVVALASSGGTQTCDLYPGWTKSISASTVSTGVGAVTLTSTAGLSLSVPAGLSTNTYAIVSKGNVCAFNVAYPTTSNSIVYEAKFSVPTLTSTTGAIFLGFGSAVTSSTTGAPAWSTTATTTGPAQSIGITVTSASGVNYLGYAVITATASNALVGTTAITVSQSDLWRVRIDATTPGNVVLSAINASWPASIGWQTVYTYTGGAFTVPLQPIISVSKSNDASAINLYVRYIGIQNVKP